MSWNRFLFDGPDWVTWVTHSLQGIAYCLTGIVIILYLPKWLWPVALVALIFGTREAGQILYDGGIASVKKGLDHVIDFLGPTLAALFVAWLFAACNAGSPVSVSDPRQQQHSPDARCGPGQLAADYYFSPTDNGWFCYTPSSARVFSMTAPL